MPRGGSRPGAGRKPAGATPKGQPISIRLPEDLIAEVDGLARRLGRSRSGVVERLLRHALVREIWRPDASREHDEIWRP